ncbi:hypothetical protein SLEP1_g9877 [Rubroshorea leprosula]|uniref:Cyclic nucleotide-binding domain-containing protein n=1 Tax=Rubroshorea leprosula TaxID=152421 RepID=A0AAV5IG73_9ROSI|nr:hypothetical protein SLEP1_g9877 [Rubroshorea leprosula]
MGSKRIKSNLHSARNKSEKIILDPRGSFLQNWNKIFLLFCIIAVALDPLFFYIPVVVNDETRKCLNLDKRLGIIACVLRTFMDAFHIIHMIFQFRTGFIAASSRIFGTGELIVNPRTIAKRYLFTYFIIDVLAILPLPQLVILLVPSLKDQPVAFVTKESLKYIIICQYVPRIVRIVPLYIEVSRTSSINIVPESARAGAALNLFLYMLASHVLGAIWYLLSVERQVRCWGDVARKHRRDRRLLYCNDDKDPRRTDHSSNPDLLPLLNTYCPLINPDDTNSTVFNFGIFIDALHCLPRVLRLDIKRHLCLDLLMRVPMFEKMDEQLFDAMCDRLKPVFYTEKSFIEREGDPIEEMLFIIRGNLVSHSTNRGITGFFKVGYLKAGDFCGEPLIGWALNHQSSSHLPISPRTVEALSEVEAFALLADDLKFVVSQFGPLHRKQLQHTFRFYSVHWKIWAVSFIQATWRRYCKRKLLKSLREEEANDSGLSPTPGATIYASRFAANLLRNLRQHETPTPRMLSQKPAEPDFTAYQNQ